MSDYNCVVCRGGKTCSEHDVEALRERLTQAEQDLRAFARVHAGAEVARRVIVGGIEGPDRFKDAVVVVYLKDVLDALDGGSKKRGLLALGDTPEERVEKGRAALAAFRGGEPKEPLPPHLRDDAPVAECGRCHRKTVAQSEFGQECRMTQPDGYPCGGRFDDPRGGEPTRQGGAADE